MAAATARSSYIGAQISRSFQLRAGTRTRGGTSGGVATQGCGARVGVASSAAERRGRRDQFGGVAIPARGGPLGRAWPIRQRNGATFRRCGRRRGGAELRDAANRAGWGRGHSGVAGVGGVANQARRSGWGPSLWAELSLVGGTWGGASRPSKALVFGGVTNSGRGLSAQGGSLERSQSGGVISGGVARMGRGHCMWAGRWAGPARQLKVPSGAECCRVQRRLGSSPPVSPGALSWAQTCRQAPRGSGRPWAGRFFACDRSDSACHAAP